MKQTSSLNTTAKNKSKRAPKIASPEARRRKVQAQKAKVQAVRGSVAQKKKVQTTVAPVIAPQVKAPELLAQAAPPVVEAKSPTPNTPEKVAPKPALEKAPQITSQQVAKPTQPIAKPIAKPTMAPQSARVAVAPVPVVAPPPPARRWPLWVGGGLLALLLTLSGAAFGIYQSWQGSGHIAPKLFIAGQPVGGMTRAQALDSLKSRFGKLEVAFVAPDEKWNFSLEEVGGTPDFNRAVNNAYWFGRTGSLWKNVPQIVMANFEERHLNLDVRWNKDKLKNRMRAVAKAYKRPARNATLQVSGAGVQILPESEGRTLNVGATLWRLQHRYDLHRTTIEATVQEVKPRLTAAKLEGTDVQIGAFSTRFNRGLIGRTRNLHVSTNMVNGKVLMPGDTFSFNATTGERTWEKGYRMAHIFERKPGKTESEVVDGLAGGVCQVSTTLYNAVRKGNQKVDSAMKIVQRESHSLPVPYISSGLDATVAWPNRDFKFKNTLPHPIYLRASIDGSRLLISVWARVPHGAAMQFAQNTDEKPRG